MAVSFNRKSSTAIICLSPNAGGMEIDTIKLAKKLSPYMPITIIAKEGHFIANSKNDFLEYNQISLETVSFFYSLSLSIILKVRQIVETKGIKNVIFFGASELKSLYFSFLGLDINLIIRHGTTKSTPKKDWFHRLIYSKVNFHISICKHLQRNVDFIIPFGPKAKNILIYSSVDMHPYNKIKSNILTLLNVGRIELHKGQADALKACQILYENEIDFIFYLVGNIEPKYQSDFMELYNSLPYRDKIIIVGHTSNVIEYYAKSDIFLFPSYGEGLSNAFLEALGHGLTCISYKNTSFPELKELGFHFEIVENKNVKALKQQLFIQAVSDESNINRNRLNSEKIKKEFNPSTEVNKYLEILI